MKLAALLFSQGFGTRRLCAGLVEAGEVTVQGQACTDAAQDIVAFDGMPYSVSGQTWAYQTSALLVLHKPAGYECSTKPRHHPSVLSLLPAPLRTRGVQPVGRLDEDTTGLLLLTDDGGLLHRLTSPKHHVPKLYEVSCKHEVTEAQVQRLLAGVVLEDSPVPVQALACEQPAPQHLQLTLDQGRYHQVKRMLAAVGNRVEALHRSRYGAYALPADLPVGQWRWLSAEERLAVQRSCP